MLLHIHDNLLVSELQERFSKCYPLLKIEFFSKPHSKKNESDTKYIISPDKRIGEIRKNHNEGNLEIKSWYRVDRVEKNLKEKFGLNVQVFRKENGEWIQTSKTDKYTFFQQAEMVRHADSSDSPKFKEQLGEYDYL